MRTLYGLSQSAWTEKARWALDHHGVDYRYHEHLPVLGELLLRHKARHRPPGTKASVPLLVDGPDALLDSLAIARHAEKVGKGEPLFPKGQESEVERWAEASDRIVGAVRGRVLARLAESRAAQLEALPPFLPEVVRSVMAKSAAAFLIAKYDARSSDYDADAEGRLRPELDALRAALSGRPTLLDGFTFADVAIASSLQALRPRKDTHLGPGTCMTWEFTEVARDYEDLLEWRESVYAAHR